MSWKEDLAELRGEIDVIDGELVALFQKRMDVSRRVADLKFNNNLAVQDESREQQVVNKALEQAEEGLKGETALFMRTVMSLSRELQQERMFSGTAPLLPPSAQPATGRVACAYIGVPGAWGEQAARCLYPGAEHRPMAHSLDVFTAVKNGEVDYGVVPIENTKTGAVGETYDLLRQYGCYIVGRTWVPIRLNLLGRQGTNVGDLRELLASSEDLRQCARYLQDRPWEQTACRSSAAAAQQIARTEGGKKAAIASRRVAELYDLDVLAEDIMDAADNRTSYVVIAKNPEYDEKSELISLTFSTQHRSGALCEALLPFMADNLNLTRIESRPSSAADKYRFFVEIQGNIGDEKLLYALRQAAAACEYFEVLGCYACTNCEG